MLADLDRQTRKFGVHAAAKVNLEHAAAGIELRIVEQVAGLGNRRKRNIEAVEDFGKLLARMLRNDLGNDGNSVGRACTRSSLVLYAGFCSKSSRRKCSQKRCHWLSLVIPTKICSPSAVANGS